MAQPPYLNDEDFSTKIICALQFPGSKPTLQIKYLIVNNLNQQTGSVLGALWI
jgi:hypothetical protein